MVRIRDEKMVKEWLAKIVEGKKLNHMKRYRDRGGR